MALSTMTTVAAIPNFFVTSLLKKFAFSGDVSVGGEEAEGGDPSDIKWCGGANPSSVEWGEGTNPSDAKK